MYSLRYILHIRKKKRTKNVKNDNRVASRFAELRTVVLVQYTYDNRKAKFYFFSNKTLARVFVRIPEHGNALEEDL